MNDLINAVYTNICVNKWFGVGEYHINAYIRITTRYINGVFIQTIELANIKVDEEYRNLGYFSSFLNEIELMANKSGRVVYVESIINPILKKALLKRKYIVDAYDPNSLYKPI